MSRGGRALWHLASNTGPRARSAVCRSCLDAQRMTYSLSAAAVQSVSDEHGPTFTIPSTEVASPPPIPFPFTIKAGVVLSRPPVITRDLHPFEKAFFLYQRRLNERLALPFTRYFYYQKDTPADLDWKKKIRERITPARDIGIYNAWGKEGWHDEVLVGATESEPSLQMEALLRDAVKEVQSDDPEAESRVQVETVERPQPRETDADRTGDTRSLNRALARTLYLLVQGEAGTWEFPSARLLEDESLQRAAERILVQAGGINMNTWIVGHTPVGMYRHKFLTSHFFDEEKTQPWKGEKTFFMKGRIMAGQANLAKNEFGLRDFQWLAKDELQKQVPARYWNEVHNMLVER